jgi:hypothetical protein
MSHAKLKAHIERLLAIIAEMQLDFPNKRFTLDGRLVGDIGEIAAAELYAIKLAEGQAQLHDATTIDGRRVQIKVTMKEALGFGNVPDYYLGLRISPAGDIDEIFNGPGSVIWEAIKHRKRPKNYLFALPIGFLRRLNENVADIDRVRRK